MKYLWLIRHAKTSWAQHGQSDFERTLAPRGVADAELMTQWLASERTHADWLVCSTAVRAAATADYVQRAFEIPDTHRCDVRELYLATPEIIIDHVRQTPPDNSCAALVGHNPGISQTVSLLGGPTSPVELPTFGCALLVSNAEHWADFGVADCTLTQMQRPKALRD